MFLCERPRRALLLCTVLLHTGLSLFIPESPLMHFNDQVRERHLYTESRRQGLFLEITPDGSVTGSPTQSANSLLELRSVRAGETVIRGVRSSLYLCADHEGHLSGQFLPVKNVLFSGMGPEGGGEEVLAPLQGATHLDSQDPFGMELGSRLEAVHSPGFLHRK